MDLEEEEHLMHLGEAEAAQSAIHLGSGFDLHDLHRFAWICPVLLSHLDEFERVCRAMI